MSYSLRLLGFAAFLLGANVCLGQQQPSPQPHNAGEKTAEKPKEEKKPPVPEENLRSHLSSAYYEAGHIVYVHTPSCVKLKADIAQFLKSSMGPAQ